MKWTIPIACLLLGLLLSGCADDMMLFSDRHDARTLTLSKDESRTDARSYSETVYNVLEPQNVDLTGDGVTDTQLTAEQVEALRQQGWEVTVL
ncbi:MAG: hypothetical protein Q8Q12_00475 [bacterium]|nr:hypothetical protein [bacterium]